MVYKGYPCSFALLFRRSGQVHVELILNEDRPAYKAVNPRTWIEKTNYCEQEFRPSFMAYTAQRAELLTVLQPLAPAAWSRVAWVTGMGAPRELTMYDYAERLATHERSHIKHIQRLLTTLHVMP